MIEIREPKFRRGDKVVDSINDEQLIVSHVAYYRFCDDNYVYILKRNDGQNFGHEEEIHLVPYIEKPKSVWDLQKGDECCFIDDCGTVLSGTWADISYAIKCRQTGNVFLTKEEALADLERRKVETEMLRLGGRREFKKGENNWFIYYNDGLNVTVLYDSIAQGAIYFDSENEAYNAIKKIGKSRIKKYIFGVEE